MKRFSDLGISQSENRKIFNCSQVSISDVVNCEIEVLDYIPDVKTSQGEGRCLVLIIGKEFKDKFIGGTGFNRWDVAVSIGAWFLYTVFWLIYYDVTHPL